MTQYLIAVHGTSEAPTPSPEDLQRAYADVDAFNKEVRAAGAWVFAGGLEPVHSATVVDGRGSAPVITDGPYAETREFLGGFWVVEAPDLDAALAWAAKGSKACGSPVEVRPFQSE